MSAATPDSMLCLNKLKPQTYKLNDYMVKASPYHMVLYHVDAVSRRLIGHTDLGPTSGVAGGKTARDRLDQINWTNCVELFRKRKSSQVMTVLRL